MITPATRRMVGSLVSPARVRMLGAGTDPYAASETALQTQVTAQLTTGDSLESSDITGAINAYVAGGYAGATVVGPMIDLAGYPNVTQAWTQEAWQLNGTLSKIGTQTIQTQNDVTTAKTLAYQMQSLYTGAIAAGRKMATLSSTNVSAVPASGNPVGGPNEIGVVNVVPLVLVSGILGGVIWHYWGKR